ncbi:MAG: tetratricopeptide repeat protein [Anaerolineae bacterium]|nr:tetratricopeptide repeat protein [Anaerolineae bacterium]
MTVITDPRLTQAKQLIQQKRRDQARELLTSYLKANPNDTNALYLLAFTAHSPEEAKKALRKALDANPLNYQARAALNKIENRSVEQQPIQPARPRAKTRPLSVSEDTEQRGWFIPALSVVAGMLILVALGLLLSVLLDSSTDESEKTEAAQAEVVLPAESTTPTLLPTLTRTPIPEEVLAEFKATWTPMPSSTALPTFTLAPSITPRPSETPMPTATLYIPEVEALSLNLVSASRLYNHYTELAAQASWSEDVQQLSGVHEVLEVMVASLEISDYTGATGDLRLFFDEFFDLLGKEQDFVQKRKTLVELQAQLDAATDPADKDRLESQMQTLQSEVDTFWNTRLQQQEKVDLQYLQTIQHATATAAFIEQVDSLKTPSATPIILPTATSGE